MDNSKQNKAPLSKVIMDDYGNSREVFLVEKVLKKGIGIDNKVYYRIKWAGEPESQSTWEPLENLGDIDKLIQEYENGLVNRPRPVNLRPEKVNYAKIHNKKGYLYVTWQKPMDGSSSLDSFVCYDELREHYPLLVINYLENNLMYGNTPIKMLINGELMQDNNNNNSH